MLLYVNSDTKSTKAQNLLKGKYFRGYFDPRVHEYFDFTRFSKALTFYGNLRNEIK